MENRHLPTSTAIYTPMGDTANKHGRVIANNICGGSESCSFPGVLNTMVYKYSDLTIGHSGLTEQTALEQGFEVETTLYAGLDKPEFLPSAGFDNAFFMEGGLSLWQPRMIAHNQNPVPKSEPEAEPAVTEAEELKEA